MKRSCPKGVLEGNPMTLFLHNPFTLKNYCIKASFSVFQYISKSKALVFIVYLGNIPISPDFSRNYLYYLDTGKRGISTGGLLGLTPSMDVIFTGVFQYTGGIGSLQTVPVIKPISSLPYKD
jgi:hypothetical protein